MPNLFGLNIAQIVDSAVSAAGGTNTGSLEKVTVGARTPGGLTGGTNPTTVAYPFRGFLENTTQQRLAETLVNIKGEFVSIFGNSLPAGIEPAASDKIVIESTTFTVLEIVSRDPAAALYTVRVQR